jgi:tetratricopeptide (TPR) repeat protein
MDAGSADSVVDNGQPEQTESAQQADESQADTIPSEASIAAADTQPSDAAETTDVASNQASDDTSDDTSNTESSGITEQMQQAAVDRDAIQALLNEAVRQLEARRLTTPSNDNAFATYREILQLDPDNTEARQGLDQIKQTYRDWAERALQDDDRTKAIGYYERALSVDPEDSAIRATLDRLEQLQ